MTEAEPDQPGPPEDPEEPEALPEPPDPTDPMKRDDDDSHPGADPVMPPVPDD